MDTKVCTALARGSVDEVVAQLTEALRTQLGGTAPQLALVFASTKQPLGELMPKLAAQLPGTTLLGASSSGEFTESVDAKSAVSLFAVAGDFQVSANLGTGLKANAEAAVKQAVQGQDQKVAALPHRTAIVLLDTLSGNAEEATLLASLALGPDVRLVGGASGDDLAMTRTLVGVGDRVATDAVVIATIHSKKPLGIGVQHGHRALSQKLKVTKSEGGTVHTIDGQPALEVWERETSAMARKQGLEPKDLHDPAKATAYLLRFEAGVPTGAGDTLKIRAPLSVGANGAINFACGMPDGVEMRVTSSEPADQIASAREAAQFAVKDLGGPSAGAVVFDCVCRNLILGDRYREATAAISAALGGVKVAGFESYGEVALGKGELSGFHNTTSVILSFPR